METGKLYKCPGLTLMVFPKLSAARRADNVFGPMTTGVLPGGKLYLSHVEAWTKKLGCHVRYTKAGNCFKVLDVTSSSIVKILTAEGFVGWVIFNGRDLLAVAQQNVEEVV